jgi:opacity protein-like surface antigen
MKKLLLAVSAMTLMMSGIVFAQAETPVIDQRQANQDQRIDQGIASGQLNEREANRLNRQQEHVNKMEDRAMSDGVMTKRERARVGAAQNRASHHIAREKHDRQGKRHQ